jgi:DNA invertase Pin-like site-specific DNA recombinase
MSARAVRKRSVRCAIYTRVSTDAGLDQDFNSLDAQYEGASAYIRSQAHAGWTQLRTRYDDGGFSGGSTDRPALQQLLNDVRAGGIDIIVVYKVDRLTRSLADFAKLVELFDAQGVSFVSVTQQFNTTTSMGRLTLNVLLSFAQFEREVTSERIRDKIAASKRKGLWVGGVVPLGYHARDRKITIVESEARTVRHIFKRYLELGSLKLLLLDLKRSGITTRVRQLADGRTIGGIPFTRGPLAYLLRNRFYISEVRYKGEILAGEQPQLLDRALFDAVQARLDLQRSHHVTARQSSDSILMGLIHDGAGNLMTPTHTLKNGKRYRYYISTALLQGEASSAGRISRIPAAQVERLVADAVRTRLIDRKDKRPEVGTNTAGPEQQRPSSGRAAGKPPANMQATANKTHASTTSSFDDRDVVRSHLRRVEVHVDHLVVSMTRRATRESTPTDAEVDHHDPNGRRSAAGRPIVVRIPWTKPPTKVAREIIAPAKLHQYRDARPIRAETRAKLVTAVAQGRRWLDELISGTVTSAQEIADRQRCSVRQVNRAITLAFLSPRIVEAAIEGRLPRGIGVASIRHLPTEWSKQHAALGLKL